LSRALCRARPGTPGGSGDPLRLRLIVDDLAAFSALYPAVRAGFGFQTVPAPDSGSPDWLVAPWNDPGPEALAEFSARRPRYILECYACGRPEWFEEILFDADDDGIRVLLNLEYLTAESWARDFHLLPSLTRSPQVRKYVFMPGFISGTGGLLPLEESAPRSEDDFHRGGSLHAGGRSHADGSLHADGRSHAGGSEFRILLFSYEHDFTSLASALKAFHADRPVRVLLAAGRSASPFLDAWNSSGRPFPVEELPMLPQLEWDSVFDSADLLIVRGEESWSRAILSGKPFVWECYPFRGDGHHAKIRAFLEFARSFFPPAEFALWDRILWDFNAAVPGEEDLIRFFRSCAVSEPDCGWNLSESFRKMAAEAGKTGNLAANLLTFFLDSG
ncbi:MAG: elongation factor P maturation arginine rhamnosyltransferase EarP, partial [Spirochaetales bacterium]|nr:elongation factor P maturation arginine rhamnosyltransferase EarP [Spirochaetales bacterium]